MNNLTESSFKAIKSEIKEGRLTVGGMRSYLIVVFFLSAIVVGISVAVANANTIGWDMLSAGWHGVYYAEGVLFAGHILLLLLSWENNAFNQKLLSVGMVIFTYKAALDPFLMVSMFSKDRGLFELFLPFILIVLVGGLFLHIFVFVKWINRLKENNKQKRIKGAKFTAVLPVITFLSALTTITIKNGLLGENEIVLMAAAASVVYLGLLIAACEFIIAAYCIFRFPSFSVKSLTKH